MTALTLMISLAFGQADDVGGQFSSWVPDGKECGEAQPIAGTAGYANGQNAFRLNAITYTASRFAEKIGAERLEPTEGLHSLFAYELTTTYDAARVPSFHAGAGIDDNCAAKYRVGARPIDVQSLSAAVSVRVGPVGVYYVASSASGQMPDTDNFSRILFVSGLYPSYGLIPMIFAPLTGSVSSQTPTSSYMLDLLVGAYYEHNLATIRASYTGTRNIHVSVNSPKLGPFASVLAGKGGGTVRGGIEDLSPAAMADDEGMLGAGMFSAFYRDLPFGQIKSLTGKSTRLRTAHFGVKDLGRIVDLRTALRVAPQAGLDEAMVTVHNNFLHSKGRDVDDGEVWVAASAGVVGVVDQYSVGLAGGLLPAWRTDIGFRGEDDSVLAYLEIMMNDPDQIDLYPFARNAVSYTLFISVDN